MLLCKYRTSRFQLFSLSNPAIDVMQSTKNRLAYNLTIGLNRAGNRRVFVKRHARSADVVVVIDVFVQHLMQMFFIENNHVVKAFATKCPQNTLCDWILPWTSWCSRCVFQAKVIYVCFEIITEDFVVVTDDIFGCFVESKRFTKLLNCPLRVRICGNSKVQYFASIV